MNKQAIFHLLFPFAAVLPLAAQGTGGDGLPPLELENVTVIGRRTLVLPAARKGEVYDSTVYRLTAQDTLLFGERVSNLGGSGGRLPEYQEFASSFRLDGEASMGTYISPRAMIRGEYAENDLDLNGVFDYRGTNGHIDSAKAGTLMFGAGGGLKIGDRELTDMQFRAYGDVEYIADDYFLYGNSLTPYDRFRSSTRFTVGIRNLEAEPLGVDLKLDVGNISVEDALRDSTDEASALTPLFRGKVSYGTDSLRITGRLDFMTTSLRYGSPTQTPAFVHAGGDVEWRPADKLFLTLGAFYAGGQHSDSGSSDLVSPRVSIRYELRPTLSLFAWYAPELRPASYRDMITRSPYVRREFALRPEEVSLRLGGGVRISTEPLTVEARLVVEQAENTPVVIAGDSVAASPGDLRYTYVASQTIAAEGSLRMPLIPGMSLNADAAIGTSVERSSDRQLPMRPTVDLRGRVDYALNPELDLFASVLFQSARNTTLDIAGLPAGMEEIDAVFALGGGAAYRIHKNVQAFAELTNLFNQSHDLWQNYGAPGLELRGGVRVVF